MNPSKTLLAARALLALIFIAAGADKIARYGETAAYMESMGVPSWLLPLVIALELEAGLAVLVGYRAKLAACLLAAFTVAAAAIFHRMFQDPTQLVMFMKNLAIAGGLLAIAAAGPGDLSMDARRKSKSVGLSPSVLPK